MSITDKFDQILNEVFEPSIEIPLYVAIALSGDKETILQCMQKAYDRGVENSLINIEELKLLSDERQRQIDKYGYTDDHILTTTEDYSDGELAMAAAAYCCSNRWVSKDYGYLPDMLFPWADEYFKPSPDDRIKELIKAGAMILAEIKRLKFLSTLSK